MQGFTPQHRKKESMQGSANKPAPQIAPKKAPGAQAQAMNQQPDSVPAMVKPGEYVLPADTVDAVGGPQALDGVVQATHMPAPETASVPQGFEPQLFFANGGAVPDEENRRLVQVPAAPAVSTASTAAPTQKPAAPPASAGQTSPSNIYPQSSPSAGAPIYQGAGFNADDFGSSNKLASVPSSIGQQPGRQPAPQYPAPKFPANYTGPKAETESVGAPPAAETAQQPVQAPAAVGFTPGAAPKPSAPAKPAPVSPTALFVSEASADAGKRWDQGDVAGAIGAGLRTGVGAVSIGAVEALDNTVGAAARGFWDGGGRMLNGLMGTPAQAAPVPPPAAPAASTAKPAPASAPAQQTPAANTTAAPAAAAVKPAATSQQSAGPVPASTTAANPTQLPAGVYQHGRGQYSDSADGMGFTPGFTGRPNAQNLEAASNLSAQGQRESMGRVAAAMAQPQAAGFRAPTVAHSGNDFAARKRLENMATAASSITNTERWGGKGASRNPAVQAYEAAVKADLQAQGMQPDVDTKVMGFNANLMREQMNQDGATQRAVMHEAGADRRDSRRAGLESRKLGMEETAQGFQTRQAQRIEGLYQQYDAAKTDQERAAIAAQIRTYQGKEAPAEWGVHVTPTIKNADGSTSEGSVYRYNKRTGQVEAVAGQKNAAPVAPQSAKERKAGTVYAVPNGKSMLWNGSAWEPVN